MPNTPPRPKPATPDMAVLVMQLCCISLMNFIVFCCALPMCQHAARPRKAPWLSPGFLLPGRGSTNHLHGVGIIRVHVSGAGHAREAASHTWEAHDVVARVRCIGLVGRVGVLAWGTANRETLFA